MQNVVVINGSPRKAHNTATLLKEAMKGAKAEGAQVQLYNLYDLNFKGCISCFACKSKKRACFGKCAVKDDITSILEMVMESDAVILGSPIYFGNITSGMRSFLERLWFMNLDYDNYSSYAKKPVSSGFIYTMNVSEEMAGSQELNRLFEHNKAQMRLLCGASEYMASYNTYQFDDYSKYAAGSFDLHAKEQVKKEQYPKDIKNAFQMGKRLISDIKVQG